MAVLGISTNTRLLGIAIISKNGLADYAMHLHKSPWSPSKATLIITSLEPCVRRYSIKKVVLSIPYAHHQTEAFKSLISSITTYFEERKIPVLTESQQTILSICQAEQKKTKKALMQALVRKYPELAHCHQKELRNKNKYYIKVFEAVGAASLHS